METELKKKLKYWLWSQRALKVTLDLGKLWQNCDFSKLHWKTWTVCVSEGEADYFGRGVDEMYSKLNCLEKNIYWFTKWSLLQKDEIRRIRMLKYDLVSIPCSESLEINILCTFVCQKKKNPNLCHIQCFLNLDCSLRTEWGELNWGGGEGGE